MASNEGEPGEDFEGEMQEREPGTGDKEGSDRESGSEDSEQMAQQGSQQSMPGQSGEESSKSGKSDQPPPDEMTRRMLDVGKGAACSKQQQLEVDKWAGEYEGERRKKLQIAVSNYLTRLDTELEAAELATDDLRARVQAGARWDTEEMDDLGRAQTHLIGADSVIGELKKRTVDTPYAFVGLQVHEIGFSHVSPAQEHLAVAGTVEDDEKERYNELDQASVHIHRARNMIKELMGKFEAVKTEEQLEAAMKRLSKMHQVFVEDMQTLMKNCKPPLNPRTGEIDEVDEDVVKAIEEYYEELKKLMDELAKVLADNPELLRRFLAAMRMDAYTIRDQLTLLAMRQEEEAATVAGWAEAETEEDRAAILEGMRQRLAEEQESIARDAELLTDNMVTWLPLDADKEDVDVQESEKLAAQLASRTRDAARSMRERDLPEVRRLLDEGELANEGLQGCLAELGSKGGANGRMSLYVANRLGEAEVLAIRQDEWREKLDAVEQGWFERAGQVGQYRLALDTVDYGVKLDRLVPLLRSLSEEIGVKARDLEETVSTDVVDHQIGACMGLQDRDNLYARDEQGKALEDFERAEKTFDELLTLVEKNAAACKGGGKCKLPTVEEILAMLENECKACEKLGAACRKINVMVQMDWMKPGSGSGMGSGSGSGMGSGTGTGTGTGTGMGQGNANAQGRPTRSATSRSMQRMMEAHLRAAQNYMQRAAERMEEASRQAGTSARELRQVDGRPPETERRDQFRMPPDGYDLREWDTLVSDLEKELLQARGNEPPREYEDAINAYFRTIADMLSEGGEGE
jgi:hypothetical protein